MAQIDAVKNEYAILDKFLNAAITSTIGSVAFIFINIETLGVFKVVLGVCGVVISATAGLLILRKMRRINKIIKDI